MYNVLKGRRKETKNISRVKLFTGRSKIKISLCDTLKLMQYMILIVTVYRTNIHTNKADFLRSYSDDINLAVLVIFSGLITSSHFS